MTRALAICIEDLDVEAGAARFLTCTVLPEGEDGLGIDARGAVVWRLADTRVRLGVAADGRLTLLRSAEAPPVAIERDGRSLEVPLERRTPLLQGDVLRLGERRLRLHVHGEASDVRAPSPLREAPAVKLNLLAAHAVEVREHPPRVAAPVHGVPVSCLAIGVGALLAAALIVAALHFLRS